MTPLKYRLIYNQTNKVSYQNCFDSLDNTVQIIQSISTMQEDT